MFTYQLQPRSLWQQAGTLTAFPASVAIEIELTPGHVLGEGTGPSPLIIPGSDLETIWNGNTGRCQSYQKPRLQRIAVEQAALGGTFKVDGNRIVFENACSSLEEVAQVVETLRLTLPAALSLYLPMPVGAAVATASHGEAVLRSQLMRTATPLTIHTQESYAAAVAEGLSATDVLLDDKNRSLLAAVSYWHVARRLECAGLSPWEFTAEVVLNYSKVLEVLWGDSRDAVRAGAASLGYGADETEGVFVALTILRDELDVAHPKVSTYSTASLSVVYSYIVGLQPAMTELLKRVIQWVREGKWTSRALQQHAEPPEMKRLIDCIRKGESARSERLGSKKRSDAVA